MADPTPYTISYSFSSWQASYPSKPLPAQNVDNELANIQTSISSIISAVEDVRRSDGALQNGIVGFAALDNDLKAGFSGGAVSAWAPIVDYAAGIAAQSTAPATTVVYNGESYVCVVAHTTTSIFVPSNWKKIAAKGTSGTGTGTGDMLAANNLADVANVTQALQNLGGMKLSVYDPTGVAADAFNRANHTGALPDGFALTAPTFSPVGAPTKKARIDASNIAAGQTRNLIMPDRDVTVGVGLVPVASFDLSTGPVVAITDMLTSGFDWYEIELIGALPATNAVSMYLQNSLNNGSTYATATDVNWERRQQVTSSTTLSVLQALTDIQATLLNNISSTLALGGVCGTIRITPLSWGRCRARWHLMAHTGGNEYDSHGSAFFAAASNAFRLALSSGGWVYGRANVSGYRRT